MIDSSGLIGVIAQETARYSYFASSLTGTDVPAGSAIRWQFGHDIPANVNGLVRALLDSELEWLWLLGDDHTWSPNLLMKLLGHDKDIVAPLGLQRAAPYRTTALVPSPDDPRGHTRLDLNLHPFGGLVEVVAIGSGGMLIKREVFETMEEPWFEAGKIDGEHLTEDIYWCDKARQLGYRIHCDLDAHIGHICTSVIWPVHEPDGWTFGFSMTGGFQITMPPGMQGYADEIGGGT